MKTRLCSLLGIDVPVILAAMGGFDTADLAAEVSEAGGLGMMALSGLDAEAVRSRIAKVRARTRRPFAVNLNVSRPQAERLAVVLDEGVRIVSFFWGEPGSLMDEAHAVGAMVLVSVGSAKEARCAVENGADVIVAQGWEAGGHVRGEVATLPLVPAVVDAVAPKPVVAAGGIADGRGLAASLALGAEAAWIGTRFLASDEAAIHPTYQRRLLEAGEADTVYTTLFDVGWPDAPHRVLRNKTVNTWEAAGRPKSGERPGEGVTVARSPAVGDIVNYRSSTPSADTEGDIEALSMWAGQSVGLVRRSEPAGQILRGIVAQAEAVLKGLNP